MNKRPSFLSAPRAQSFGLTSIVLIALSALAGLATLPETMPFLEHLGWAPVVSSFVLAAILEVARHVGNIIKDSRADDDYSAASAKKRYYF